MASSCSCHCLSICRSTSVRCLTWWTLQRMWTAFRPATPAGILALLKHNEIPLQGKHVVVLGKSDIVGRPLSLMLAMEQGPAATVTMCDRFTENTWAITRTADIIVVAAGKHHLLNTPSALRADGTCVLVDVGIHRVKKADGKM